MKSNIHINLKLHYSNTDSIETIFLQAGAGPGGGGGVGGGGGAGGGVPAREREGGPAEAGGECGHPAGQPRHTQG